MDTIPVHVHHPEHNGPCPICAYYKGKDNPPAEPVIIPSPTDHKLWLDAMNCLLYLTLPPLYN